MVAMMHIHPVLVSRALTAPNPVHPDPRPRQEGSHTCTNSCTGPPVTNKKVGKKQVLGRTDQTEKEGSYAHKRKESGKKIGGWGYEGRCQRKHQGWGEKD